MKIFKKSTVIFTLFIMLCNFFITPISVISDEINGVDIYIANIESNITAIENKFATSKSSDGYSTDESYKYAVDNVYSIYQEGLLKFNEQKDQVNSVNLRDLLVLSNETDLLNVFDTKGCINESISFDEINDVMCFEDLFITKDDLTNLITKTYYLDFNSYFTNFLSDFDENINKAKNFYTQVNTDYNTVKGTIKGYIDSIEQIVSEEELKENVVDLIVDEKNVLTELNKTIEKLDEILQNSLTNKTYSNDFDGTSTSSLELYNKFIDNNKYSTSELLLKIDSLITKYEAYDLELETLYTNNSFNYLNIDYINARVLDNLKVSEFITAFEKAKVLDEEYIALNEEITTYLNKKVSETNLFTEKLDLLNSYYNKLNNQSIFSMYSNFVFNANLLEEDIIDTLLGYTSLEVDSKEYDFLMTAKKLFYPISLKDSSVYTGLEKDDFFVIEGIDNLEKTSLETNVLYGFSFNLKSESTVIDKNSILELFDRDDNLIKELSIVIRNDVDGNGIIDNNDVESLKEKLLEQKLDDYDNIASDVNNDEKVDVNDLVSLQNMLNQKEDVVQTTDADFNIVVNDLEDKVEYKVYLKTDGVIRGLQFEINNSSNLKLIDTVLLDGISFKENSDLLSFVGLGEYKNDDLLVTITYEKIGNTDNEIILNNGTLVFDNLEKKENLNYYNSITNIVEEEKPVVQNLNNEVKENNNQIAKKEEVKQEVVPSEDEEKESLVKESVISGEELDQDTVVWGNVIKIAVIVLLGALIIYFLNREDKEEITLDEDENKKEEK